MGSPEGYFDDRTDYDPAPRGGPMLVGDMTRLAGVRAVADARESPGPPLTPRQRKMKRKHLMILLCRVNGLPMSFIADGFGLTRQQISKICSRMGYDDL